MKNVKNVFQLFLSTLLCLSFLLSSNVLTAQEGDGDTDGDADIEIIEKEELKCDSTITMEITTTSYCSKKRRDLAVAAYLEHLDKAAARYVKCEVNCEEGETCAPFFHKWTDDSVMPQPVQGHPGCRGFYFAAVTSSAVIGCSTCEDAPSDGARTVVLDLQEDQDDEMAADVAEEIMEVFPNPADEAVNIEVYAKQALQSLAVAVYDLEGKMVMSRELGSINEGYHSLLLNTAKLETGMYIVTLNDQNRLLKTTKLSINR